MADYSDDLPSEQPSTATPPPLDNKRSFKIDKDDAVARVLEDYESDLLDRADWTEQRIQRYAKYRGWLEPKNYPWPNAANTHNPILMTDCQRMQDTLHNAVIGNRPPLSAIAAAKGDTDKGGTIDELLDHQMFVEQEGEERIGEVIDSYVNEGTFVAFTPWVKVKERVPEITILPPPPKGSDAGAYILQVLQQKYPGKLLEPVKGNPFKWKVRWEDAFQVEQEAECEVFTDSDNRWTLICKAEQVTFDGPCLFPKVLEDVVVPTRAANLQPPSPANPGGADHVILVDYPTKDEVLRLAAAGYYDLLDEEDLELLEPQDDADDAGPRTSRGHNTKISSLDVDQPKILKDKLEGRHHGNGEHVQKTMTRLMWFGRADIDGDDLEEEVVYTVIYELKLLCKARLTNEIFPSNPPKRPFAEARLIPVAGYFYGIGMWELLEHLHDLVKMIMDQSIDKNTLGNSPFGFYRAASGVRPEVMTMAPGDLYPVSNPAQDIAFPQMPNMDQTFSLNMLGLVNQWAEKQAVIGELQFGRVPAGKASALRTTSGMQTVLQQGDARPERILRRFFRGLAQVYENFHVLNQTYLSPGKQYRVSGITEPGKDPYRTLDDVTKIKGRFDFEFKANSLNTNKAMQSQILQGLSATLVNGLMLQTGIVTKEGIYNLVKDIITSQGQDPHKYINPPSADSDKARLTAEDALASILVAGMMPDGVPQEGTQVHMQKLQKLLQSVNNPPPNQTEMQMVQAYMQTLQQRLMEEQQLAMQAQQFAALQTGGGGGGGAQPGPQPPQGPEQFGAGQVQDQMSLGPQNGGGASAQQ